MKMTRTKLVQLIQESLFESNKEQTLLEGPVSGTGMGGDVNRPSGGMGARQSRSFDPKNAEAFAAKYNYDFNKIAALQNDEAFMSNPSTRAEWAEFNDYAATNLPPEWKTKWDSALARANHAAKSELNKPGMVRSLAQKVAGKVSQLAGGKKLSADTMTEIETLITEVVAANKSASNRFVAKLNESEKLRK